uniref:DUF4817 domain-containing protein n=1 Tax=Anoplophora glabripennis TaxID=217634 RepID=V5G1N2_ANOGL
MPFLFTNQEQADIHFCYGFADGNSAEAVREYRRFPHRRQPHYSVFINIHRQFSTHGLRTARPDERQNRINIRQERINNQILREFNRDPTTSSRRVSRSLRISKNKVLRVLKKDHRRPYHLQPVQGLHEGDEERRLVFCRWVLNSIEQNEHFLSHILWTDESCFTRQGVVNFHNQHVWAHENPHAIRPRNFQVEFSVNVWKGVFSNYLFGPYFLLQRVNGDNFLEFLITEHGNMWEEVPLNLRLNAWFQLDGCPAHFHRNVRGWLDYNFPQRWIGRGGPISWPPRSPDLTPLDFFVWGYVKDKVYMVPVHTREELIDRIQNACDEMRNGNFIAAAQQSIRRRCELCVEQNGSHFEQLL